MKTLFITGISSGIGQATARHFLERGDFVIGTCRNLADVSHFQSQFPDLFIPLQIDLTDLQAIAKVPQFLQEHKISNMDVLVNNAGVAVAAPFELQYFSEIQDVLHLNVVSVMKLTQVLIPHLKKTKGRIINISSISGKAGAPFLAAYCASKHAIEGFSESLRREMNIYGIKVSLVAPGSIQTPIWNKGFQKVKDLYSKTVYATSFQNFMEFASNAERTGLPPQAVVQDIVRAVDVKFPKFRYAPIPHKLTNWYLPNLIPARIYDWMMVRALKLNKP